MNNKPRFSNLTDAQRAETISTLTAAARKAVTGLALSNMAERHILNSYGVHEPMTGLIGLCYRAEQNAGTLAA